MNKAFRKGDLVVIRPDFTFWENAPVAPLLKRLQKDGAIGIVTADERKGGGFQYTVDFCSHPVRFSHEELGFEDFEIELAPIDLLIRIETLETRIAALVADDTGAI